MPRPPILFRIPILIPILALILRSRIKGTNKNRNKNRPAMRTALILGHSLLLALVSVSTADPAPAGVKAFNLDQRKQQHWCWRPVVAAQPPAVKNSAWPKNAIDNFLLAKLEAQNLRPAPPADPRTLIRRLYFD